MNIFGKRPLAFFCFVFIGAALAAATLFEKYSDYKPFVAAFFLAGAIVLAFFAVKIKRFKLQFISILLSFLFVFAAFFSSYVFHDLTMRRAESFEGNNRIVYGVVEEISYKSDRSAQFVVKVTSIDGEKVREKISLHSNFTSDLERGDKIAAKGRVAVNMNPYIDARLTLEIFDDYNILLLSRNNNSISIFFVGLRANISEKLDEFLGESGPLATGFFIGDTSGIDPLVKRDFRRTGITHILSVSGFHFSVLMGALELLLRVLRIPKKIRIFIMTAAALFFLAIVNFTKPAVRSAIMLFAVYASYVFLQDSDSLTALFFAMAAIIFVVPAAVIDLGLWLSFLATLGIIVVYPIFVPYVVEKKKRIKRKPRYYLRKFAKGVFAAAAVTFCANLFVVAVASFWFGEISILAIPANLAISSLGSLFLILTPVTLLVGGIPVIGALFSSFVAYLGVLITDISAALSKIPFGMISLRFGFAQIIVVLMTAALAVLMVVNFKKRKYLVLTPFVLAVAAYAVCFSVWNGMNKDIVNMSHYAGGRNESFVMNQGSSAVICDISSGTYESFSYAVEMAKTNYATEIGDLVLTHYHDRQPATLDGIFRRTMFRRIWLPVPATREDAEIALQIADAARELDVKVNYFEYGEQLNFLNDARLVILPPEYIDRSVHPVISFAAGGRTEKLTYVGSAMEETESLMQVTKLAKASEYLIFGTHGPTLQRKWNIFELTSERTKEMLLISDEIFHSQTQYFEEIKIYALRPGEFHAFYTAKVR